MPELGDAPIQDEVREQMNRIARFLDEHFNGENAHPHVLMKEDKREWGFVLLLFRFGEEEETRCNFISNGSDRKQIVSLMKEMTARLEGQPEICGHA